MAESQRRTATVLEALAWFLGAEGNTASCCVAYSGGVDSHVLLHALASLRSDNPELILRAVHVDHALQPDSEQWSAHCESVCTALGVPLTVRRVSVTSAQDGPEGDARRARYRAFVEVLQAGELLLLAQHADDQAETFLLQALRGSGPDGLAGMPVRRALGQGMLCRPLLDCTQQTLLHYATEQSLAWIDDPSNGDTRFDRNFLRRDIMPLLRARWPAVAQTLSRSAQRSGGASRTLLALARDDLADTEASHRDVRTGSRLLDIHALRQLPRERVFNVVRLWVRQQRKPMPKLQDLIQVMRNLIMANDASAGIVSVGPYAFRRYAHQLHLVESLTPVADFSLCWEPPFAPLEVPEAGLVLTREHAIAQGLRLPESCYVTVRRRRGGELLKTGSPPQHRRLKNLWQERGVPPWQRDAMPLLFVGDELIAIWDLATSADYQQQTLEACPEPPSG